MTNSNAINITIGYNLNMPGFLGVDRAAELNKLKKEAKQENQELEILSQDMRNAIQEQNEYIIEIENLQEEIISLQNEYSSKIQSTNDRYFDLANKRLEGTLTEEEQKEFESLEAQRNELSQEGNSKINNINATITTSKNNYKGSENKLQESSNLLSRTKSTINGLNEWNENNSIENGGGKVCEKFIQTNNTVISDLTGKTSSLSEKINEYSKSYSFLKN